VCLRERDNWEVLVLGETIILKWNLQTNNSVLVMTWLRIETDGCLLSAQNFSIQRGEFLDESRSYELINTL
jgi:hypothetical protein